MPFDKDGNWVKPEKGWEKVRGQEAPKVKAPAQPNQNPLGHFFDMQRTLYGDSPKLSATPNQATNPVINLHKALYGENAMRPSQSTSDEGPVIKPYVDNRSTADKVKDFFSSVFSDDGEIHNKIRAGADELAAGAFKSMGIGDLYESSFKGDPTHVYGETTENLHQQNLEHISPKTASALDFTGQVLGLLAPTGGAAATGGKLALRLGEKIFEKAPAWLKKLGIGALSGAGTGATLATGQELLQANNDQSFGEHLGDIGKNTAYFAGYGTATPIAGKIMGATAQKIGQVLPAVVNQVLGAAGQKAPLIRDVSRGVTEGALTGSMVGSGMALGALATTGDPNKALDVITGEAGSEMKENFVESIAFGIVRRLSGKGIRINPVDASEQVAEIIMDQFPPEVRAKLEVMVEQARIQGADDMQAKSQVIDIMGSLPDGKGVLEQASAQILQDMATLQEPQQDIEQPAAPVASDVPPVVSEVDIKKDAPPIVETPPITPETIIAKPPESPSKPSNVSDVQTQEPTKQAVSAAKGDRVILRGKPNTSFEVVDIGKTKATLRNAQGGEFVTNVRAIASVLSSSDDIKETIIEEPSQKAGKSKYGRSGTAIFNKELKQSHIDLETSDGRDFKYFFEKYYNAGLNNKFMPHADIHQDMARQFYEAGKKDVATEQTMQKPTKNDTVEATKPAFTKGNRVTWTNRSGKALTGTITSIDTRDDYATVDTDQIAVVGGGIPIGRIEIVPLRMLSHMDQTKTAEIANEKVESKENESPKGKEEMTSKEISDWKKVESPDFKPTHFIGGRKVEIIEDGENIHYRFNNGDGGTTRKNSKIIKPITSETESEVIETMKFKGMDAIEVIAYDTRKDFEENQPSKKNNPDTENNSMAYSLPQSGEIHLSPDFKKLSPDEQERILGHEVGHVVYSQLNVKWTQEMRDEWIKASQMVRPEHWAVSEFEEYLNQDQELFSDAFSVYWMQRNTNIIRKTADKLKDYVPADLLIKSKERMMTFPSTESKKRTATPLFHGSAQDDLTNLQEGSWFSPVREFAEMFASYRATRKKGAKAKVYETSVYLDDLNLVDISEVGMDEYVTLPQMAKLFKVSESELRTAYDGDMVLAETKSDSLAALRYMIDRPSIAELLKSKGYDGIKAKEGLKSKTDYVPTYKIFGEISLKTTPEPKSLLADSDSKPKKLTLYHGSNAEFEKFKPNSAQAGKGVFLTDSETSSKEYGEITYTVEIIPQKIASQDDWLDVVYDIEEEYKAKKQQVEQDFEDEKISEDEMDKRLDQLYSEWHGYDEGNHGQNAMISDRLKDRGFDVLETPMQGGFEGKEYLVLDESIIKSVKRMGPKSAKEVKQDETIDTVGNAGRSALEGAPSKDVQGTESVGAAKPSSVRSTGTDEGRSGQSDIEQGDGTPGRLGERERDVDTSTRRGDSSDPRGESGELDNSGSGRKLNTQGGNYVITNSDDLGLKGKKTSYKDNVKAIRLMKEIMSEGRIATPDEQKELVKYVGWGGIAEPFSPSFRVPEDWKAEHKELKELLTEQEWQKAADTILNAHYTSVEIIQSMYDGLRHFGFNNGRVLEPSMGIGHFIGLLPNDLKASVTGVEIDTITGNIAKLLYPKSDVRIMGFEEAKMADNFYDVAIGNVPFGNYGIADPRYKNTGMTSSIHNYFFAKALDKVRPGGLVMFITSKFTMDSRKSNVRKYISSKADLVGAIRLPNNAFKKNAGTEVVADILIFKKREEGTVAKDVSWIETEPLNVDGTNYDVNAYFIKHPKNVIGTFSGKGSMYGSNELTVTANAADLQTEVTNVLKSLPSNVIDKVGKKSTEDAKPRELIPAPGHVKENAYVVRDGKVFIKQNDLLVDSEITGKPAERIKGMTQVRDAVRDYLRLQLEEKTSETVLVASRKRLNKVYDDFVKKFGFLNEQANTRAFVDDPDAYLLLSLENYDKDSKTATKTAIFKERTVQRYVPATKADNAKESLIISLNEKGYVDIPLMAKLTGNPESQVIRELEGHIYNDPQKGWVTDDEYLSGNVKEKLAAAQNAVLLDPAFQENVTALEKVQPVDLSKEEIDIKLGSHWIQKEHIQEFIAHIVDRGTDSFIISYNNQLAQWSIEYRDKNVRSSIRSSTDATVKWGTGDYDAVELLDMALNMKTPTVRRTIENADGSKSTYVDQKATVAVREKQNQIKEEFSRWIWSDEKRAEDLLRTYNDRFNTDRLRKFEGEHLSFPGMNPAITLKAHQKTAVWRAMQKGNTLFAHAVGAGKTFEMIAAMMELKRTGIVGKPMWVVPNHLVEQMGSDFMKLYPAANILVAGKKDFEADNRKKLFAKITTGNYDAVIVPHSSFGRITMSKEAVERFYEEQLQQLELALEQEVESGQRKDSGLAKQLRKARKSLTEKMDKQIQKIEKDDNVTFEELGIDGITVDEAHEFKNLFYGTKLNRVAGLGNPDGSGKAFDLFMKVRYLQQLNGGRGVIFATGTPVSNSLAEMYTFQRYLQYDEMNKRGILSFDSWVSQFGDIKNVLELSPEGKGLRMRTRLNEVVNLPELLHMFRDFADVQTADELLKAGLITRPDLKEGKRIPVVIPATEELRAFVQELADRAEAIRTGKVKPDEDNMLAVVGAGRKAALDMRLVDPNAEVNKESKVVVAANNIVDIYKRSKKSKNKDGTIIENGTQLVFLDMSTPKGEKTDSDGNAVQNDDIGTDDISVYNDLRKLLVKKGIPLKEIAFIHDYPKDKKEELFRKVNSGEIRVLIGSTAKMGAGMNVQKRLKALHHLDVPWRPSDIEQREGRVLRQGNDYDEVEIYAYMTEESFDAYMWQTIANKAKVVDQTMSGDLKTRRVTDPSGMEMSANELKALATGDIRIMELANLDRDVAELDLKHQSSIDALKEVRREISYTPSFIKSQNELLNKFLADQKQRQDTRGDKFVIEIEGNTITERKEAGKKIMEIGEKTKLKSDETKKLGSFAGFSIVARGFTSPVTNKVDTSLYLKGSYEYVIYIRDTERGTIQSLESTMNHIDEKILEIQENIEHSESEEKKLQKEVTRLEEETQRLKVEYNEKLSRKLELEQEMNLDQQSTDEVDVEDGDGSTESTNNRSQNDTFIPQKEESVTNVTRDGAVTKSDIVKYIMKEFKVPLGTGKYRGQIRGLYKPGPNVIRTKMFGDFLVLAHELGHRLERKYGLSDEESVQEELFNLAHSNLEIPENMDEEQVIREGVADFMRMYFYEPQKARNQAPEFYDFFESRMQEEGLLDKLGTLSKMLETWHGQTPDKRISGVIDVRKKRGIRNPFKKTYANYVDELVGLQKAVEKLTGENELSGKNNPYLLAWKHRGIAGKIETFLEYGVMDENGEKVSESLKEILNSVKDLDTFRKYLIAKHAITLREEGKWKTPISMADANRVVADTPAEYVEAAEKIYEFQEAITKLLIRSGMIEKGKLKKWKEARPFYVPFYRVLEESGERDIETSGGGQAKTFANLPQAVKAMKEEGSAKNIIDPLESMIKNTFMYISLAERNDVGRALARLVNGTPESASIMEKIDRPMKGQTFQLSEIEGVLEDAGFDVEGMNLEEMATIFRPIFTPSMKDRVLIVWVGGKQQFYQVRDQDLYEALLSLDGETLAGWIKLLSIPNNILRTGITSSPSFIPKGPMRGLPTMLMQTDSYTTPLDFLQLPFDLVKGFMASVGKGDDYHKWLDSGAGQSTILSIERDYLLETKNRLLNSSAKEIMLREAKTLGLGAIYKTLRYATQTLDEGFRITEYKKALSKTGDRVIAAVRSRDVDLDFNRFGKHAKNINRLNLFFNVAIQGPNKTYRTFKEHPIRTAIRGTLFLTLPTLALMALNWDDEDYWELEQWERDLFWNIPRGDGTFFRIPIPFEWGLIFKTIPERIITHFARDDRKAFDDYFKTIRDTMVPSVIPTYAVPMIEWIAETDLSTGIPTLSMGDKAKPPEDQYGIYTSEFAKKVGDALKVSPKKIDHLIKGTTGSLGQMVAGAADFVTGGRSEATEGEKPTGQRGVFERAFIADSADGNTYSVRKFYDLLDEKEEDHKKNGIKGEPNLLLVYLRKASGEMTTMRKLRDAIYSDLELSGKDKGKAIHQVNLAITDMARVMTKKDARNKENLNTVLQWGEAYKDSQK